MISPDGQWIYSNEDAEAMARAKACPVVRDGNGERMRLLAMAHLMRKGEFGDPPNTVRMPWSRPNEAQWCAVALRLYRLFDVIIGRDDRRLENGDVVFVLNHTAHHLPTPIQEVDCFHGVVGRYVMAQMCHDEVDVRAHDMIHTSGCSAKAVGYIQRIFRAKRIQASLMARRLLPRPICYPLITHMIAMYLPPVSGKPPRGTTAGRIPFGASGRRKRKRRQ